MLNSKTSREFTAKKRGYNRYLSYSSVNTLHMACSHYNQIYISYFYKVVVLLRQILVLNIMYTPFSSKMRQYFELSHCTRDVGRAWTASILVIQAVLKEHHRALSQAGAGVLTGSVLQRGPTLCAVHKLA
jgi:hypothetical protein